MPKPTLSIEVSNTARQQLSQYQDETPELETMIRETLSLDPRPAYRRDKKDLKEYRRVLFDRFNIHRMCCSGDGCGTAYRSEQLKPEWKFRYLSVTRSPLARDTVPDHTLLKILC